jgi:DEAD/DEAH box helicase domain-containing protein
VLCDPRDICAAPMVRAPFSGLLRLYLYDAYPGGLGIARRIFDIDQRLFAAAADLIAAATAKTVAPPASAPRWRSAPTQNLAGVLVEYLI